MQVSRLQAASLLSRCARCCVAALAFLGCALGASPPACAAETRSPDGRNLIAVDVEASGRLVWRVARDQSEVIGVSALRLDTRPTALGAGARIDRVRTRRACESAHGLIGKRSQARACFSETRIGVAQPGALRAALILRAYNDGVAYRWRLEAAGPIEIVEEPTEFRLAQHATLWALPIGDFVTDYEQYYQVGPPDRLPTEALIGLPMLVKTTSNVWAGLTEADLSDYAGFYLRNGGAGRFDGRLSPSLTAGRPAVVTRGPRETPWRVVLLGDRPGALIESALVQMLNPPSRIADTSWIRPGKTTFPWWNDYVFDHPAFTPGLNTETMLAYIDFCAEAGIPYHTLDGYNDEAWYGGRIAPDETNPPDITKARPEIDLPRVLAYARQKGVGVRVWTHWRPFAQQIDRALDAYAAMGVDGVMVDFMNRDDQEMVRFYEEAARKAAERHLTIIFHGFHKPTGMERTWPNVLTYEGVRNLEYNKFDDNPGSTPVHETMTPFVRMLAGPMDYHQGGVRHVSPDAFRNRFTAPINMGTRARTLATYVVFDNPGSMVADSPSAYRRAAGLSFIAAVPVNWDETRIISGEPGEFIVAARRKGADWWIGAMTNGAARTLSVPLNFLPSGRFAAAVLGDDHERLDALAASTRIVSRADTLTLELSPAGGAVVTLTRAHALR